jgi:hypothetical protein
VVSGLATLRNIDGLYGCPASGGYDGLEVMPLPRVVGKLKRFLTHDQVQALMRAVRHPLIKVLAYAVCYHEPASGILLLGSLAAGWAAVTGLLGPSRVGT